MKYLLILSLIVSAIGCSSSDQDQSEEQKSTSDLNSIELTEDQVKVSGIQVGALSQISVEKEISLRGRVMLSPTSSSSVSTSYSGTIEGIRIKIGDRVAAGQVIAHLINRDLIDLQQQYLTTKAQLAYSESDYKRQNALNAEQAASDKQMQQAKRDYQTQKITLQALHQKLLNYKINPNKLNASNIIRTLPITATSSGIITKVNVHQGKYLVEGEEIVRISNSGAATGVWSAFPKDINGIYIGQNILWSTEDNPNQLHATVKSISPELNPDQSTDVYADLPQAATPLREGQVLVAKFKSRPHLATAIPAEAIVQHQGQHFIIAHTPPRQFQLIPIKPGHRADNLVEISFLNLANAQFTQWVLKGAYPILMKIKNVD